MIYDYIAERYEKGEPIFLSELPGRSRGYLRLMMKKLVDEGKLERLSNGVYYLPYTTILGTKGKVSMKKYLEKKYLSVNGKMTGYVTGLQLANLYGFTTQNPSCYEVCSNEATTRQRKQIIDGNTVIVYAPPVEITEENKTAIQFLDLMSTIDRYSEISGDELKRKIRRFIEINKVDYEVVKRYLPFFPDKVYRNLYETGVMKELVGTEQKRVERTNRKPVL